MTPSEQFLGKLGPWPFAVLWGVWLIYWRVSARGAKHNEGVESRASRLSHMLPPLIGLLVVMATQPPRGVFTPRLLPFGIASYATSFGMVALGLAFTVWARVHLGANWSAYVARKLDPELVRSGPYAWVRHPIYSGLLLAFLGVAVGRGDLGALLGCGLMWYGLLRKLRIEERWLQQTFGDAYTRYREEVPGLLPWPSSARPQ
ncbi:MAG TPA: isoprenylcysteine carboxylmethyltransferase family protein [Polyangiales bacterium]|nr:isoprenylcysteine carboxylmethyltransferase family protein [Polyangiales bacterium]